MLIPIIRLYIIGDMYNVLDMRLSAIQFLSPQYIFFVVQYIYCQVRAI